MFPPFFPSLPEVLPDELLHELDVSRPVAHVDGLQRSPVVDGVHLSDHLRGDREEVTGVDTQPAVLCLK